MGRLTQAQAALRRAWNSARAGRADDDAAPHDPMSDHPTSDGPTPSLTSGGPTSGSPEPGSPEPGSPEPGRAEPSGGRDSLEDTSAEDEMEPPAVTEQPLPPRDANGVPRSLQVAAAWSWRLVIVVLGAAMVIWALAQLHQVVIPFAIAMLLTALLSPAVRWLRRHRVHRTLATAIVVICGISLVAGTLTLVVSEFVNSYPELSSQAQTGVSKIQSWLKHGIFHLSDQQLDGVVNAVQQWLRDHQSTLTTGAIATATTALDVVASIFLVLFTTFFLLRDGDKIWRFVVNLLPPPARTPISHAGEQSWLTLVAYVRATVLVAFIDAVGIGIWIAVWQVELAFALAALVFLGAFIPIVGATLSGAIAVLVALVTRGPVTALIILAGVIGVQQLEGHILQPFIMGRAVSIHPLAVILAIATGVVISGIVGALVAVPLVAVLNTGIRHLAARRRHEPDPPPPEAVVVGD